MRNGDGIVICGVGYRIGSTGRILPARRRAPSGHSRPAESFESFYRSE
jgi:hypothetical protein